MNRDMIAGAIESILFISGDAVDLTTVATTLDIERAQLDAVVDEMISQKQETGSGILLVRIADKLQLCTNPAYSSYVESVLAPVKKSRLSQSLVETLAIIAYRQPITRYEIEQIRGVQCSYSLATLIEKGLILRAGRKKTLGNPMLYVTNDEFLRHFGLGSLDELPELSLAES